MSKMCVCCAAASDHLEDFHNKYVKMFYNCFSISINRKLKDGICVECLEQLNKSNNFKKLVIKTQIALSELKTDPPDNHNTDDEQHEFILSDNNIFSEDIFSEDDDIDEDSKSGLIKIIILDDYPELSELKCDKSENGFDSKEMKEYDETKSGIESLARLHHIPVHKNESVHIKEEQKIHITCMQTEPQKKSKDMKESRSNKHLLEIEVARELTENDGESFECDNCGESYKSKKSLAQHMTSHTESVSCGICFKTLSSLYSLTNHMNEIHSEIKTESGTIPEFGIPPKIGKEERKCLVCEEEFHTNHALKSHMNIHYPNFKCDECGKGYMNIGTLRVHMLLHTEPCSCDICFQVLPSQYALKSHKNQIHNKEIRETQSLPKHQRPPKLSPDDLICPICEKIFKTNQSLRVHINIHFPNYVCDVCGKAFTYKKSLHRHNLIHTGEIECKICGDILSSLPSLRTHINKRHKMKNLEVEPTKFSDYKLGKNEVTCPVCREQCDTNAALKIHMNKHLTNFGCDVCGNNYTKRRSLLDHKDIHSGPRTCEVCGKVLPSMAHLKTHTKLKHSTAMTHPFKCSKCDERFLNTTSRILHLESVHGARLKRFTCTICSKAFLVNAQLTRHMFTHGPPRKRERKYGCNLCPSAYTTREQLMDHKNSHTGAQPYKCQLCPKTYPRKTSLRMHMNVHDRDRQFLCSICTKCFTQKCALNAHMKVHHIEMN